MTVWLKVCSWLNTQGESCEGKDGGGVKGQVDLFDMLHEEKIREMKPILSNDQMVYILSLDVILIGAVNHSWVCGEKNTYFGYSIDLVDGLHTVIWDYNIGKTVFTSQAEAEATVDKIRPMIAKIIPSDIAAHDVRAFEYIRELDGYKLTAIVARVGEMQLYEEGFYCYHFLRTYKSRKERDKKYDSVLKKILEAAKLYKAVETSTPQFETLYRVTDELFASREYAQRHGVEYAEIMGKTMAVKNTGGLHVRT